MLLDMYGEDACIKKSDAGPSILLDKTQTDILNESWRISAPVKLTAYKEAYKGSFPVHEKAEEMLKVPSLDDIVETFLIKRLSGKATFKRSRSLFTQQWKEIERLAFQGQTAARMGIVISLYVQQALAMLLQELKSDSPNLDSATQTVRDTFAMSTKIIDQLGRTEAYDHFIRRKAALVDMGLDSVKDVDKHADLLPLTGDGVLGKEFEVKLKERKEKNKEFKDLVPEISGKKETPSFKRKSTSQAGSWYSKHMRFDNERSNRNYGQNRIEYSTSLRYGNNYRSSSFYGQRSNSQQKKSYSGVSSFRTKPKSK